MDPCSLKPVKKPDWLRIKLTTVNDYSYIKDYLSQFNLHTICESGKCPNIAECWESKTATFMILGNNCTRNCKFCAVNHAKPLTVDENEPEKLAEAISKIGLKHCVITSVTRDDLADGGAKIWKETVLKIKQKSPDISIEVLIPDFNGDKKSLDLLIESKPDIISHNLETVRRLTTQIRFRAQYQLSLEVLKYLKDKGITTKSGIMLGLGETHEEVLETMDDLLKVGCKILTVGQYLQPSKAHYPVQKYYSPSEFSIFKEIALKKGFSVAECGPLVRSSYHAEKHVKNR